MNKVLLTFLGLLFCSITFAQSVPQGINYQAVATDETGQELTNHPLEIRLSIISDISSGNISWQEIHQDITNSYGLFTAIIGQGRSTSVGSSSTFDFKLSLKIALPKPFLCKKSFGYEKANLNKSFDKIGALDSILLYIDTISKYGNCPCNEWNIISL